MLLPLALLQNLLADRAGPGESDMKLVGASGQFALHPLYRRDGAIIAGGTPQLVFPQRQSCSILKLQNLSNGPLWFEFGSGQATATITDGSVTSIVINNGGFGFTYPPIVQFLGGGQPSGGNTTFLGGNLPGYPSPGRPAHGRAILTGGVITSIAIDDPGAGYLIAPYVHIIDSPLDPYGSAAPSLTSGMLLGSNTPPYILNGTCATTDPIAVYGETTGQSFLARYMD